MTRREGIRSSLLDIRVLHFGDAIASAVAGHRLALLGAEVVVSEPAGGCWLRTVPWSVGGGNALWDAWAGGLHSASADDEAALVEIADVVIATTATADQFDLDERHWESQLLVVIDDEECRGEFHAQASCGMISYLGSLDQPPVRAGFEAVGWAAGVVAVQSILAAIAGGRLARSGAIRIDAQRVAATLTSNQIISHSDPDEVIGFAAYQDQPPEHGFRAADAWLEITFFRDDGGWDEFCRALGCAHLAQDERYSTYPRRTNHKAAIAEELRPYLARHEAAELEKLVRSCGGLVARHVGVRQAATSDQSRANELASLPSSTASALTTASVSTTGIGDGAVDEPVVLNGPWALNGCRFRPGPAPGHWEHADSVREGWRPTDRVTLEQWSSPLKGTFVVDVTEGAQGPFAVSLLADLGASVVKVERPGGEFMRHLGPFRKGDALPFLALNHGRQLAAEVDLQEPEGTEVVRRLARTADLFVENWRHGTAERLGLGPVGMQALNGDLVYLSASGFGSRGPLAESGALDQISQAASGMWSLSGSEGGEAERYRGALLDYLSALVTVEAALIGLIYRARHGSAPTVEVSQLASALSVCQPEVLVPPERAIPLGSRSRYFAPSGAYQTSDNRWMAVEVLHPHQWERLKEILNCVELESPRFTTNRDRVEHGDKLHEVLSSHIASLPPSTWEGATSADGIVEVSRPLDVLLGDDGLLRRRGHVVQQWCRVGPVLRVPPPWEVSGHQDQSLGDVGPVLGAQTVAVKRLLGLPAGSVT